jgi:hypothetical protein
MSLIIPLERETKLNPPIDLSYRNRKCQFGAVGELTAPENSVNGTICDWHPLLAPASTSPDRDESSP